MQRAPVAVHRRSACSGLKALRNTSDARRQAAKLRYRFGPLTPSARSANLIPGDGAKNGLSRSEQKTVSTTQNNRLTGKAPYRFESCSLQRRVHSEPDSSLKRVARAGTMRVSASLHSEVVTYCQAEEEEKHDASDGLHGGEDLERAR